jgi:predicted nuclease of predicted toxin-antitoxin system
MFLCCVPPQVIQVCFGNVSTRQIAEVLQARADDTEQSTTQNMESVFMLRG